MKKQLSPRGVWERQRNEEDAIREIMDFLALNRIQVWRSVERIPKRGLRGQIVGRYQSPGLPDLTGFAAAGETTKYAMPFWIEVKGPSGRLRPAQERFLSEYQSVGLFAFMARTWEEVKAKFVSRGIEIKVG